MAPFLRGMIDADGSVYHINDRRRRNEGLGFNLTATRDFSEGTQRYINEHVLPEDRGHIRKNGVMTTLAYSGDACVLRILDWLYDGSTDLTRLDRKYEKYMAFKTQNPDPIPMRVNFKKGIKSTEKHMIYAFDEIKSIMEWADDPRCVVGHGALYRRVFVLGMQPEDAMITKIIDPTKRPEGIYDGPKISRDQVIKIRNFHKLGKTAEEICRTMDLNKAGVLDVVMNRSHADKNYEPRRNKEVSQIVIEYNGKSQTIREWSNETGIPYSTIDRRVRMGLPLETVFSTEEGRLKLGKAKSAKDEEAYVLAKRVREDYKAGIIGKANYEKHGIPKSRYIDLIGNRTCKEQEVWWK
jgi:hypothetical protein